MNYLINPSLISKILKNYFFDIDRLWNMDQKTLQKFQEKSIRKIVNYAYDNITFYRKKYERADFHPDKLKSIEDFKKIPFISKDDLRRESLKNLLPMNFNKEAIKISTSGTTGKPVSIYVSMYDIIQGLFGYLRTLREHGINWRKDNLVFLLDLRRDSAERNYFSDGVIPKLKPILSFENIRVYSIFENPKKLIKELDKFQPNFIGGYVGILGHLAILKEEGLGKNISPKKIASTGTPLDKYLRIFIEEAFNTSVFDAYGATESGPIAFECSKKKMHVNSDLVYTEFMKDEEPIYEEKPSNLVITKLYGQGTPIIRYTGINDILTPAKDTCDCKLGGSLIKKIYGRESLSLIFPNNKIMLPSAINEVFSKILYEFKTRIFTQRQIIQHEVNKIEIKMVINHKLEERIPITRIFSMIKDGFNEKIRPDLDIIINIKEVKKIDQEKIVISKINKNKFKDLIYI